MGEIVKRTEGGGGAHIPQGVQLLAGTSDRGSCQVRWASEVSEGKWAALWRTSDQRVGLRPDARVLVPGGG